MTLPTFHEGTDREDSTSCSSLATVLMWNNLNVNSEEDQIFTVMYSHALLISTDRLASIRSYDDMPIVSANIDFSFLDCFVLLVLCGEFFFFNQQRAPETQSEESVVRGL